MLSDNTSYRVCEILTSSDSSPLINFASGLSAILDVGFIWDPVLLVFSATRDLTIDIYIEWRLIWCCLALSRARYSVLSHDYDVNILVCFAEPSRALFFGERKKNIVTMKRIMKLLIASALLLSLTKAAQSVKQDGKIHSFLKRISRVSTFPAPKFFRRVLMKQF